MKSFKSALKEVNAEQQKQAEEANRGIFVATDDAIKKADEVLSNVTAEFAEEIAINGVTDEIKERMHQSIEEKASEIGASYTEIHQIQNIAKSATGLGPLENIMDDPTVTEIMVLRYDHILIERSGILQNYDAQFNSEEHLQTIINKLIQPMGKSINIANPIVDAAWEDGSRINATIPPVTPKGATLTIRKFSEKAFTGEDYKRFGSVNEKILEFLRTCVRSKISIFISGGTGTGKTTFINMLSNFIPENENVVTIEDTPELKLESKRVRSIVARRSRNEEMMDVDISMGVKNALRMRPDRIIVGEVRGGEMVDMIDAMSTGHEGSMATVHANSPDNLVNARYISLFSRNKDLNVPVEIQHIMFAEAVQLIIQLKRYPAGTDVIKKGSRKVTHVTAVEGIDENGKVILKDIFKFDEKTNTFYATGYLPNKILDIMNSNGIFLGEDFFDNEDYTIPEAALEEICGEINIDESLFKEGVSPNKPAERRERLFDRLKEKSANRVGSVYQDDVRKLAYSDEEEME